MTQLLDTISSSLQSYVIAPIAAFGVAGFVFDITGEQTADLRADITDHYTEDNRALQDHIAIKPKRVTLRGYVGELTYDLTPSQTDTQQLAQKLVEISGYLPQVSAYATQTQALLASPSTATLSSIISDTSNIYGLVQNLLIAQGNQAKQSAAYNYFKALMTNAVLMSIQTPWEYMTSMAIESISATQAEDSIFISEFSVTFKEIRIASTSTINTSLNNANTGANAPAPTTTTGNTPTTQGALTQQAAPITNLGNVTGASLPFPSLPAGLNNLMNVQGLSTLISITGAFL